MNNEVYVVTKFANEFYDGCPDDWSNTYNESERHWYFHSKDKAEAFAEKLKADLIAEVATEEVYNVKKGCHEPSEVSYNSEEDCYEYRTPYGFDAMVSFSVELLEFEDDEN